MILLPSQQHLELRLQAVFDGAGATETFEAEGSGTLRLGRTLATDCMAVGKPEIADATQLAKHGRITGMLTDGRIVAFVAGARTEDNTDETALATELTIGAMEGTTTAP